MKQPRKDHGGGLDAAVAEFGGTRKDWLDLSTGINPIAFPFQDFPAHYWTDLPDRVAQQNLIDKARSFWKVPEEAEILPTAGLSQVIAQLPGLVSKNSLDISEPTYNEYENSFLTSNLKIEAGGSTKVFVHPNNPDGRLSKVTKETLKNHKLTIIDESFCDVSPKETLIELTKEHNVIVLKGLGKFWGLAGLRLGFAIAHKELIAKLSLKIGPWAVSGPAQHIGAQALADYDWANKTRIRLAADSNRLDAMMQPVEAKLVGGTNLFRLYETENAEELQNRLAKHFVWSRRFPYSKKWVRLGLPGSALDWEQLQKALET